jgi:hypothetical protein
MNKKMFAPVYANDNDAWVPELWANESVLILLENMVAANLVHKDFSPMVANFGDVVNTRKPTAFTGKRKVDGDDVTVQDATSTNIPVTLNQHFHVSFLIKDGEESKSFADLIAEYLKPAVEALASSVDKVVVGQTPQFLANNAAGLGEVTSSTAKDDLLDVRKVMNVNKAYVTGRNLILGPTLETLLLKDDTFTDADKVGDDGTALREASLGKKLGFQIFMDQNASDFVNSDTRTATTLNAAEAAGQTVLSVASATGIEVGDMVTVAGDMIPHRVTAVSDVTAATDTITVTPALRDACDSGAAVKVYIHSHIDSRAETVTTGYAAGWAKYMTIDGYTSSKPPVVGQFVYIEGYVYTIIDVVDATLADSTCTILLDRPLDAAVLDDGVISMYPTGNYGFAFHRNAIALVTRPLATPKQGTGALSAVVDSNGVGVRVTITYNGTKQGHLVTVDMLCGIKVLDVNLGAVLLG